MIVTAPHTTKASLKKDLLTKDQSFHLRKLKEYDHDQKPTWHYHEEIELVYIEKGTGKRHVGNHISNYTDGELILIGKNLPHFGFLHRFSKHTEVGIRFREDFLGSEFFAKPEMRLIQKLIKRSQLGLSFGEQTKNKVGELLADIHIKDRFQRLIRFLEILHLLSKSKEYTILNSTDVSLVANSPDMVRLNTIFTFVRNNFYKPITLKEVADLVSITVPAFCRFFKKETGRTFVEFLNDFRVVHACKLLSENNMSISEICFESGFNNISHFNKQFKIHTNKTPRDYRKEFDKLLS